MVRAVRVLLNGRVIGGAGHHYGGGLGKRVRAEGDGCSHLRTAGSGGRTELEFEDGQAAGNGERRYKRCDGEGRHGPEIDLYTGSRR